MSNEITKNIAYLDGWRGIAIFSVLAAHFGGVGPLQWMGGFGVQLFFVLSGYLMSHLLFIKKVNLPDFFARRISRVIPTFFFFVFMMYLYAANFQSVPYSVSRIELISTLTFISAYFPSNINIFADSWPVGHLWSLNVEEHSYVFLAVIAFATRKAKSAWWVSVFLAASTACVWAIGIYYTIHPPLGSSPWGIRSECAALGLIAGAAIRLIRQALPESRAYAVPALLPVLTFLIAVAAYSTYAHKAVFCSVAPIFLAFTVNFLDVTPKLFTRAMSWTPLRWFGTCSFSLYLWQQPFYLAVRYYGLPKTSGVALALLIGTISFYALENPMRLKMNGYWSRRRNVVSVEIPSITPPVA